MEEVYEFLGNKKKLYYLKKYPFLNFFETKKWFLGLKEQARGSKGFQLRHFQWYCKVMNKFLKYVKLTPEQLLDEIDIDERKRRRERVYPERGRVQGFYDSLAEGGCSPSTCQTYASSVMGFYKHNGYKVSVHISNRGLVKEKIELDKETIKKVLDNTQKLRDKVIILIMTSSGMSIEDVLDLKYRHVKNRGDPFLIDFRRVKNSQRYITFFSTECVKLLKEYLKNEKNGINDNDFLFTTKKGRVLYYQAFYNILSEISIKVVGTKNINTKSFRRFFSSQMKASGVSSDLVEYMSGHSIGVSERYLNVNKLKGAYKEHENAVTIYSTLGKDEMIVNKDFLTEINNEIASQRREINELRDLVYSFIGDQLKK